MLAVCADFEHIARVVLERGDKESHSRRKRRSSLPATPQQVPQKRAAPLTPQTNNVPTPQNVFTPGFSGDLNNQSFSPMLQGFSPSMANMDLSLDFSSADFNTNILSASNGSNGGMGVFQNGDMNGQHYSGEGLNVGSFQQPFVPSDLWQMPMALEWDWADMGARSNGLPAAGFDIEREQDHGMNGPMQ